MIIKNQQINQIANNTQKSIQKLANSRVIGRQLENSMQIIAPVAAAGFIAYDTVNEVKSVRKEDRKNVLLANTALCLGAIAGGKAGYSLTGKLINKPNIIAQKAKEFGCKPNVKNFISKIPDKIKSFPYRDLLENLSIPAGAIISNIFVGEIVEKVFPTKSKTQQLAIDKAGILAELDYGTMGKAYNYSGFGIADSVDNTFSTISGFSVGKEKGLKNKIKRGVFELASGVLVPLGIILPFTNVLKQKIPHKGARGAITFGLAVSSTFAGKTAARWMNKKITDKIIEHKMWQSLSKKQSELVRKSLGNITPEKRQELLRKIHKVREIKQTIKKPDFSIEKFVKNNAKLDIN